jgi:hypothetical protein
MSPAPSASLLPPGPVFVFYMRQVVSNSRLGRMYLKPGEHAVGRLRIRLPRLCRRQVQGVGQRQLRQAKRFCLRCHMGLKLIWCLDSLDDFGIGHYALAS